MCVEYFVDLLSFRCTRKSLVLLFAPCGLANSWHRFLLHHKMDDIFSQLRTAQILIGQIRNFATNQKRLL